MPEKPSQADVLSLADRAEVPTGTIPAAAQPAAVPADAQAATSPLKRRRISSAATAQSRTKRPGRKGAAKIYRPSVFPRTGAPLPLEFVAAVQRLEAELKMPVWLFVLGSPRDEINPACINELIAARHTLPPKRIALLIHSSGGSATDAYKIARLLRLKSGGFTAVIPRWAKSAATLLSLGADLIIMGECAELGPLDVQIADPDREHYGSALDEVQSLERLNAFSLEAADSLMFLFMERTRKKIDTLLPLVLHHAAEMMRPLLDKLDTVHFTQMSRELKVAEAYAIRLMEPRFGHEKAHTLATELVENFPEHGFPLYAEEAVDIGLHAVRATKTQDQVFDIMHKHLRGMTAVGRIKEVVS